MKALVITGSRADRNGLEVVHEALLKAGHQSLLQKWTDDYCCSGGWLSVHGENPDVVVLGGDRSEILCSALTMSGIPIAHIAGGDVTTGSADDRYRDAITQLSCIHFATNLRSFERLYKLIRYRDEIYHTGSPAIDRIKQTPTFDKSATFIQMGLPTNDKPTALVCVHPKTVGPDPFPEAWAVREAMTALNMQCVCLGANADNGGEEINAAWADWCNNKGGVHRKFALNVSPQMYYSLMTHCDVMVGNSSAGYYEAPSFGLPVLQVGDRQEGRVQPGNVHALYNPDVNSIANAVKRLLQRGRIACDNPYGDGNSATRIVKALEENEWRWKHGQKEA